MQKYRSLAVATLPNHTKYKLFDHYSYLLEYLRSERARTMFQQKRKPICFRSLPIYATSDVYPLLGYWGEVSISRKISSYSSINSRVKHFSVGIIIVTVIQKRSINFKECLIQIRKCSVRKITHHFIQFSKSIVEAGSIVKASLYLYSYHK